MLERLYKRIAEYFAALAGLEVIDPENPPPTALPVMVDVMQREVDRAHADSERAFYDYEHRIVELTKEVARLKAENNRN